MMDWSLPQPRTAEPLAAVRPERMAPAYVDLLGIIYHAEFAAMDSFDRLVDASIVRQHDALLRARPMLVSDERRHLLDLEQMMRGLGANAVPVRPAVFNSLWDIESARHRLVYPLPPHVAAMFILITESLGYVVLHHLATRTNNDRIAATLASNVHDERAHLRAAMRALFLTLKSVDAKPSALADLAVHLFAFGVLSRGAARCLGRALQRVGWRPEIVLSSAGEFTLTLLERVVSAYLDNARPRSMPLLFRRLLLSPAAIRALMATGVLPEPTLVWPMVRLATRAIRGSHEVGNA